MIGKILVVDDVERNVRLLETQLNQKYYCVVTASSSEECIRKARETNPSLILLDVMMPGADGYETCKKLKEDKTLMSIPVVMVTALTDQESRIKGLEAGADDFLMKPINYDQLFSRVQSSVRLRSLIEELILRNQTNQLRGLIKNDFDYNTNFAKNAEILVIDDDVAHVRRIKNYLSSETTNIHVINKYSEQALVKMEVDFEKIDLIMVSMDLTNIDGVRICAFIRNELSVKYVPILMTKFSNEGLDGSGEDLDGVLKGLEVGATDYIITPISRAELLAKVNNQIKYKKYAYCLKKDYEDSLDLAAKDSLTHTYNRNYFEVYKEIAFKQAITHNYSIYVMVVDIDLFKSVNDTHGHQFGDLVLQEVAKRIQDSIRASDLLIRYGGEEFVIIISRVTGINVVNQIALRILNAISDTSFEFKDINKNYKRTDVTVSIGVSGLTESDVSFDQILARADKSLYEAKNSGRNCIKSQM